jgi:sporulation protein YlmC with PRC-barrel domain
MNATTGDTFPAARRLIGAHVVSSDGKGMGHVVDLEVDPQKKFEVSAVELGRFAWLDRLRLVRPIAHARSSRPIRTVAWKDIERLEDGRLICRPGATVKEQVPKDSDQPSAPRTAAGG